jgi:hypothetical protein
MIETLIHAVRSLHNDRNPQSSIAGDAASARPE